MQTLPGPTPTLVASAPQFSRSITASGVATLPAITKAPGSFCFNEDRVVGLINASERVVVRDEGGVDARVDGSG